MDKKVKVICNLCRGSFELNPDEFELRKNYPPVLCNACDEMVRQVREECGDD